jgi:gamma-glutamyl AIG2-like cyclotransferase
MDNTRDLPGYKHYLDPETGDRPAVYVAYLDLVPDPRTAVNGVVFPVEDAALRELDQRERNYERRDVTAQLDPPIGGRAWTYIGTAAARERLERGRERGATVVDRVYFDTVRDGFAQLGPAELERFDASTDSPPAPMTALRRVDMPPV